jgi:hypothetical protein
MEETKVVRLQDASDTKSVPNELTIQRAKELLELAKEGELRGFIIVGETRDGALFEGGAEIYDLPLVLTGLELAKVRLLNVMINGNEVD